jgi:glycerophosphoryl diester phosphodiesterase
MSGWMDRPVFNVRIQFDFLHFFDTAAGHRRPASCFFCCGYDSLPLSSSYKNRSYTPSRRADKGFFDPVMNHDLNRKKRMEERVERLFHHLANGVCRRWPRSAPPAHLLSACRIISHRGEHDNLSRFENTLAAFDAAVNAAVWGIELDLRWTRDLVPVVFHDPDTRRLFNDDARIGRMTLATLKQKFPLIPTLAEVIDRYASRVHLMIEIKTELYPAPAMQSRRMQKLLGVLSPGTHFHLMGLHPGLFGYFDFLPANAFVPISRIRMDRFSRMAAAAGWGGIAGHYLLATNKLIARHHRLGQRVGTGFADSRRCLFREVTRGVDWIFSNRAAEMQAICRRG